MIRLDPSIGLEADYRSSSLGFGELYTIGRFNFEFVVIKR